MNFRPNRLILAEKFLLRCGKKNRQHRPLKKKRKYKTKQNKRAMCSLCIFYLYIYFVCFAENTPFGHKNRLAWNVYIAVNTSSAHQPKNPEAHALTSQLASRYWRGIKYKLWAQNSDIKWLWDVKGAKVWLLWAAVAIIRNRRSDDTKVHPIWMKGLVSRRLYSWLDTYY